MVTKERYLVDSQESIKTQCTAVKIRPIELSSEKKSNSIFWVPLIPAPWHEKKDTDKIRIEIVYEPTSKECKTNEVYLLSDGLEYSPEMAFLFEFRGEETRCIYEFKVSGSEVSRNNAAIKLNKSGLCGPVEQPLFYKKETVYENDFQAW
jgi:hypothetical protein